MKKIFFILMALLMQTSAATAALQRTVSNFTDDTAEGTLRVVLQDACDTKGDDSISFTSSREDEVTIYLTDPLVIPEDCLGKVFLQGLEDDDIVLDAARMDGDGGTEAGDSCVINVYSSGNSIQDFSVGHNQIGAGICLFGQDNTLKNMRVGLKMNGVPIPNRYGVVMSDVYAATYEGMTGEGSAIKDSNVSFNFSHGIYIHTNLATISSSEIYANGGCPDAERLASQDTCVDSDQPSGVGIFVAPNYHDIVIGGDDEEGNTIRYNHYGGVWVSDGAQNIFISHNIISRNYGDSPFIDLGIDGVTYNDFEDGDDGANDLVNTVAYAQGFPLVADEQGEPRFWIFGVAPAASSVELYQVAGEDTDRGYQYGGGDVYLDDVNVYHDTFKFVPEQIPLADADQVTFLVQKDEETSEYAINMMLGPDADLDAIPDAIETSDGANGTSVATLADTDGDGLADAFEDKNRNGQWDNDLGETAAFMADSDADSLSDYFEMHGDERYDVATDTNPLNPDTDGDGLLDGDEDENGNGIIEVYLGETNPLLTDTDSDGITDSEDNCPHMYNAGQEDYC